MRHQKFGAGEYDLMKEEYLRECTPSDLGYAVNYPRLKAVGMFCEERE